MIFYKVPESPDEDCTGLIRDVLTNDIKLDSEGVNQLKFCGVHRLGKQYSRGRARPIIVRFTCRNDRDKVWRMRQSLRLKFQHWRRSAKASTRNPERYSALSHEKSRNLESSEQGLRCWRQANR